VLFVLGEYWPYVLAALLAGGGVGWWLAVRQETPDPEPAEAEPE
jgi:hypothetical protein